jgi:hypothetical protein
MMKHETGRHEAQVAPSRRRARIAMALAAVSAAVVAITVSMVPIVSGQGGASADQDRAPGSGGVAARSTTPTADPTTQQAIAARQAITTAVESCRLTNLRQQASLGRAAVSLEMWNKHVEAMNLLVAGKISLAVAYDFWESSRVGAIEAVTGFEAADKSYSAVSGDACAPLPSAHVAYAEADQPQSLASCTVTLRRGDATLRVARPAVTTWLHHIHDMEALRAGRITPAQATAKWRRDWKAGVAQLKQYSAAVSAAAGASCPLR